MFSSKDLFFTPTSGAFTVSKSLRFRSSASAYLYRTFGSPTNQIKWTYSFWYKRGKLSTAMDFICSPAGSGQKYFDFLINASNQLVFQYGTSGTSATDMTTAPVLRDPSAFYHVVLAVDLSLAASANRVRIYLNNVEITAGTPPGQNDTSYLFNTAVQHTIMSEWNGGSTYSGFHDGYITEVNFIDGQQLTPSSFGAYDTNGIWQPTAYSGSGYGNNGFYLKFTNTTSTTTLGYDSDVISTTVSSAAYFSPTGGVSQSGITFQSGTSVSNFYNGLTTDIICFNNPVNAFLALDAGSGNTLNLTRWGFFLRNASANETWSIQYSSDGSSWSNAATGFSPSAAGWNDATFSSVGSYRYWRAIVTTQVNGEYYTEYRVYGTGTYNNANDWTPANISLTSGTTYDSMLDSPTNAAGDIGNYCVLNSASIGADATLSEANLTIAYGSSATRNCTMGTIGMSSGKWYWEITVTASSTSPTNAAFGITTSPSAPSVANYPGFNSISWGYYGADGNKYTNGTGSAYGNTFTTNDVIGVAFDADNGKLYFSKNNTWQNSGDPAAGTNAAYTSLTSGPYFPAIGDGAATATYTGAVNFGQRPFTYTPPSGFSALNTQNLPTPTIANGAQHMAATLWSGNSTYPRTITNDGNNTIGTTFQPDFVWMKARSIAYDNILYDVVRGTGTGASLVSNATSAEGASSVNANMSAFTASGFTIGSTSSTNILNVSGQTFVGWQWKAGGTGVTNTSGSITSTVSANTTAGFSVVTYTGTGANATVGHGLGVAPSMIIVKNRNSTFTWRVYHASLANTQVLYLSANDAATTETTAWNSTTPASTVFSIGTSSGTNGNTNTYVAYCFAPVAGYSVFGSYTGNASTDGPFVYTGFRPRFIMVKRTDTAGNNWRIWDTSRATYNAGLPVLYPNTSDAEDSVTDTYDILSNGFKLRGSGAGANASGGTFIYACFAENPFKISRAR